MFHSLYHCIDDLNDLAVHGGQGTESAKLLEVDIVKCTGKDYCKSEEQIKEHFASSYFFLL